MSVDETSSIKRTRASGDVLDFLLREFEQNHNPSPELRKEISEKTNMTEKAVRIWFQNRRAKIRKFERMGKNSGSTATNSVSSTFDIDKFNTNVGTNRHSSINSSRSNSFSMHSQMSPSNLFNSQLPIDVNEKYCFIDISSLSVGSWQRIKSGYHDESALKKYLVNLSPFALNNIMPNVDLLVILSKKNFEINYFFSAISNNSKILFRIFYPVSSIITCSLLDNNINKENNELRVSLSHQPKFSVYFFNGGNSSANQWSICDDFSEDQQVSTAYSPDGSTTTIPHVLVGAKSSLQFLNSFILENNSLYSAAATAPAAMGSGTSGGPVVLPPAQATATTSAQVPNHAAAFPPDGLWDDFAVDNATVPGFSPSRGPDAYKLKGFSPLGADFDSDTSPNSITSNQNNPQDISANSKRNSGALFSNINQPHAISEQVQHHYDNNGYEDMFSAHTPDFLTENRNQHHNHKVSISPTMGYTHDDGAAVNPAGPTSAVANLADPDLAASQSDTPLHGLVDSGVNHTPFDFTLQNTEYDTMENHHYNGYGNESSPPEDVGNNHVDNVIDYNYY